MVIEKTKDFYSAYAENIEFIYGAGATVQKTKESVLKSIQLYKRYNKNKLPKVLQTEPKIIFKFNFTDGSFALNKVLRRIEKVVFRV